MKETDEFDNGSVKPSSQSGMEGLMWNLFIFGVAYIHLWSGLWLSLMYIMIIFDVGFDDFCCYLCLCDVYFSLDYSGTGIPKRTQTVWSWQKLRRIKLILSGDVFFEKNLMSDYSSFVPSDEEKAEGKGSSTNE